MLYSNSSNSEQDQCKFQIMSLTSTDSLHCEHDHYMFLSQMTHDFFHSITHTDTYAITLISILAVYFALSFLIFNMFDFFGSIDERFYQHFQNFEASIYSTNDFHITHLSSATVLALPYQQW